MTRESPSELSIRAPDDGHPPPLVPDHKVFQCIGAGAYGKVWMAANKMGEWRAVKAVYQRSFAKDPRSYRREYKGIRRYAAVSLKDSSFLPILHVGRDNAARCFFYIMELADHADGSRPAKAEGYEPRTLRRVLGEGAAKRPLPWNQCVDIGSDLAEALDRLHTERLIHRDVKPTNIIFVHGRAKLADVGLVAEFDATRSDVGTLMYLSPETAGRPEGDRYALGKVLYEMATGRDVSSFPALPPMEGLDKLEHRRLLDLNDIFTRACTYDSTARYQDTTEMVKDLLLLKAGESLAEQRRTRRWSQLTRRYGIGVILAFLAAVALLIMYRKRAAEQARGRELLQAELLLAGLRSAGWTTNHQAHIRRSREVRTGRDLWDNAASALAGMEMVPLAELPQVAGSSVAFGMSGQVLFGGLSNAPAHLWNPDTDVIVPLHASGDGPVGFDATDTPLQFVAVREGRFALREVRTGQVRRDFSLAGEAVTGHDERPALALATNCIRVAAAVKLAEGKGRWAVWDSLSGQELGTANELVRAVAFSPDGSCLATGDVDGNVVVRAVPGLAEIFRLQVGRAAINSFAFGPDLADACSVESNAYPWLLAVGDNSAVITVCELATRKIRTRCLGSSYYINALAFSPDGTTLATAGYPGMRVWDVATGQPLLMGGGSWKLDVCYARGLAYSPNGQRLAVASEEHFCEGSLRVLAVEDNRGIQTLRGLDSQMDRVWWSPDGRRLAALAHNWDLGVWQVSNGMLTHVLRTPIGASADNAAVVFSPDGRTLAFAAGSKAFLYDLATRRFLRHWDIPPGYCDSLQFEGEDCLLHLHSEDKVGRPKRMWVLRNLFAPDPLTPILEQKDTNWLTWETVLLPEGYFLVKGGPRNRNIVGSAIQAWRTNTAKPQWEVTSTARYNQLWWTRDSSGRCLEYVPETNSTRTRLLSLPSGRFLGSLDRYGAISPSGEQFAEEGEACLFWEKGDFDNAVALGTGFGRAGAPEFSPDGSRLAWPVANGWILVADLAEVKERLRKLGWKSR